jgi:hypothetical protein
MMDLLIITRQFIEQIYPNHFEDDDEVITDFWNVCKDFFSEIHPSPDLLFDDLLCE